MNKLTSCDRYKIGFFGLLIIVVGMIGYYVSSSNTNLSYKNRASINNLNELPAEGENVDGQQGVGEPDLNNFSMIATISSMLPEVGKKDTYRIAFVEVPYKPLDGGGFGQEGSPVMLFSSVEASPEATPDPDETITETICSFVGTVIPQTIQVPLPEEQGDNGTVSQTSNTKVINIPIDSLITNKSYELHTFLIEYMYTPADQKKVCVIKNISMQEDEKKANEPSPTPTDMP
ncbi:MAG: hypothetical protein WAV29_03960 [Microgenomates group bacterium]